MQHCTTLLTPSSIYLSIRNTSIVDTTNGHDLTKVVTLWHSLSRVPYQSCRNHWQIRVTFKDRLLHFESDQRFSSTWYILSDNLGFANKSHHLDHVNFSAPKIPWTLLCWMPSSPHVGQMIETKVVNMSWHIANTCPKSRVASCAL